MSRYAGLLISLFFLVTCAVPEISGLKILAPTFEVNRGESITFSTNKDGMDSYVWKHNDETITDCTQEIECTIEFFQPSSVEKNVISLTVSEERKDKTGILKDDKSLTVSKTIVVNNLPLSSEIEKPSLITFLDTDNDIGEIGGDVIIYAADNELYVTSYVLLWGSKEDIPLEENVDPIGTIQSDGSQTYTLTLDENTAIPDNASYMIVFSQNEAGKMEQGISILIEDVSETQTTDSSSDSNSDSDNTDSNTDSNSDDDTTTTNDSSDTTHCSGTFTNTDQGDLTPSFTFLSDSLVCTGAGDYTDPTRLDLAFSGTCAYDGNSVIISFDGISPLNGTFNTACTTVTIDSVDYSK